MLAGCNEWSLDEYLNRQIVPLQGENMLKG